MIIPKVCKCGGCGEHEYCRGVADQRDGMCLWCSIERKVERRWQKMLKHEAKEATP